MDDINSTYRMFKNKFKALKDLPENKKLCVDQETQCLYADNTPVLFGITILQSALRSITSQTRDNLNSYLEREFIEYKLFMRMIKDVYDQHDISGNICNNSEYDSTVEIMKDMLSFNLDITPGLTNINNLYPDHPIKNTIDNIFKSILEYNQIFTMRLNKTSIK